MSIRPWTRGTAVQRAANSAVPVGGEFGIETDTGKLVVANGVLSWKNLSPLTTQEDIARFLGWAVVTDPQWAGGADPTGATDSLAAIQAAVNSGYSTIWFPQGIYGISGSIALPQWITIAGSSNAIYPNFTTDYEVPIPSWGTRASTIQYLSGHGAIFTGGSYSEIRNMVFRSASATGPTSADLIFATPPSYYRFLHNVVQSMYALAFSNSASWSAALIDGNQFTACNYIHYGCFLDSKVCNNTFTSIVNEAIHLTNGAGPNQIYGNRFEFGTGAGIYFETGSRYNTVTDNVFDAHFGAGIIFAQTTDPNTVTGNLFWRNGRGMAGDYTDCHILLFAAESQVVEGNVFHYGGPDIGSAWSGPNAVIGLDSCIDKKNRFSGNDTRYGAKTSQLVSDRFGTSTYAIEADSLDLPAGANPGTSSDDAASALSHLASVLAGPAKVWIYENRDITNFVNAPKILLAGVGATPPTLTNSSGSLNSLYGVDNITFGGLTYSTVGGSTYASAQPNGFRDNGGWPVGKRIYNTTPTAGGTEGWILTAQGSPDTWKTFGAVGA